MHFVYNKGLCGWPLNIQTFSILHYSSVVSPLDKVVIFVPWRNLCGQPLKFKKKKKTTVFEPFSHSSGHFCFFAASSSSMNAFCPSHFSGQYLLQFYLKFNQVYRKHSPRGMKQHLWCHGVNCDCDIIADVNNGWGKCIVYILVNIYAENIHLNSHLILSFPQLFCIPCYKSD